jgi:hypothetical protein
MDPQNINSTESEIWKPAVSSRFQDGVNDLEVSNLSRVRKNTGYMMKPQLKDGYHCIKRTICTNGPLKTIYIHHLVAETFIGKRPEGLVIDHIDGNKHNNRADNLRYLSNVENSKKGNKSAIQMSTTSVATSEKDTTKTSTPAILEFASNLPKIDSLSLNSNNQILAALLCDGKLNEENFVKLWSK